MSEESKLVKDNECFWRLFVPDEHCVSGLEVGIYATTKGIRIGGELISWDDIEIAKSSTKR